MSSFLSVWGRGMPTDQLTPKASASIAAEIDPFQQHHQHQHQQLRDPDEALKTPMPNYPNNQQQQQQHSPSMATTALKAFNFTNKPMSRAQRTAEPPPSSSAKHAINLPPVGLLSLKIIAAKSLKFAASHSRPYVFAQFDNSEFASREPIGEEEEESRGVVVPTHSSEDPGGNTPNHQSFSSNNNNNNKLFPSPGTLDLKPVTPSEGNGIYCLSGQNPTWKQEVDFDVTQYQQSSKTLYVSVYDRSVGDILQQQQQQPNEFGIAPPNLPIPGIEGIEMFLGEAEIKLDFESLSKAGGWVDQWYPLTMKNLESVEPIEAGTIRIQLKYKERKSKKSLDVSDFEFLKMIGKGTFGRVFQVRKKDTRRIYAMKVLSKKEVIDKKEVQHTIGERNILQQSSQCPFLLGLKFSFQSPGELFLVMDYKSGGELFHHLQKEGRFTEERARFYTAEIILALEHLHKYNIVYRDLKPENILLDATGHIVLCDFGLSKPNLNPDELTTTFCGTTEYLAPEVLLDDHGYSKLVDFWSLGVLLFEMCCGWSPFYAEDNQQMYKNICFGKIKFPRGVIGDDGKQFVKGLLNRNPKHRLGSQNDTEDLKKHEFFKSIDWKKLSKRQIIPTFKPHIESDESVSNFDSEFTQLNIEEHLPMTIKDRMLAEQSDMKNKEMKFDENDRSDDWVKQASYAGPASLLMGHHHNTTKKNLLFSPAISNPSSTTHPTTTTSTSTTTIPTTIPHTKSNTDLSPSDHPPPPNDVDNSDHPGPVPLKKSSKSEEQDHFLGFSYHGESELLNLASRHNTRNNSDDDDDDGSPSPSSPISTTT